MASQYPPKPAEDPRKSEDQTAKGEKPAPQPKPKPPFYSDWASI
ncbi:MAG: hypothetical protein WCD16_12495 [Paracoccaceae bacterium]